VLLQLRGVTGVAMATSAAIALSAGTAMAAPTVTRYAGVDRFATSAAIVDANYSPGVPVAYVATGLNFPDALAGGAAAANEGGPLLLVLPDAVPAPIAAELQRLQPGRIVVLGGLGAISDAVLTALQTYTTGAVTRVMGADRYQTAASLAASFAVGSPVYVATGVNFPDALAATAAAAAQHAAILLTDPLTLPPATGQALTALQPSSITIVGSTNAVSAAIATQLATYSATVTRISGSDRFATAASIAATAFPSATSVFIASGDGFADALTGGPVAGTHGEPLLLSTPVCLPDATASEIAALQPTNVTLLGGTATLAAGVASLSTCPKPPAVLACTASMSNPSPAQYHTTVVQVSTSAGAGVTTVAHYRTTSRTHTGVADGSGVAAIPYDITNATIGFRVVVDVTVTLAGSQATCATSFTPIA
jgi:putative cell wall-binding protein